LNADTASTPPPNPLLVLLTLARRARAAGSADELAFLLVNDSLALHPYRQAALCFADGGVRALSGVIEVETNAPYVHWLTRTARHLMAGDGGVRCVGAADLPATDASEWSEWLPEFALWLPISGAEPDGEASQGGLLLAAEQPWPDDAIALISEWVDTWAHAWTARARPGAWSRLRYAARACLLPSSGPAGTPWWKQRRVQLAALVLAILAFPVRLSVLAPGELVAANPANIRAPLDGVLGQFHVSPNQAVKAGQPLFSFDEAAIAARLDVASQALATAQVEYRQFAQQAVSDVKSKAQLANLLGRIEEKRAEAGYLREQLERSRVLAPRDGIALFDDPSEWIGKPVQTGERVMRIAAPEDVEVEAWLAIGDAIALPPEAPVSLYLAASPLDSLAARVRYVAHDALPRPDGNYAYRLRARLDAADGGPRRIGLKGTAKIYGAQVPLVYWVLRRPLATVRQALGL
jgi:multidrug efflux pump subunit AcrA (membrane-fusion protein)